MFKFLQRLLEEHTKQCNFTWSTRPAIGGLPGVHYDHSCVNDPGDADRCNGPHICRNWNCSESRG